MGSIFSALLGLCALPFFAFPVRRRFARDYILYLYSLDSLREVDSIDGSFIFIILVCFFLFSKFTL